ncbi:hypothetical protein KIN20_027489 [Parelaphostrongylus tenuis]|uniref:Uncharacterized protein n=1 Tax=Parelaphostrongylus tenuis TaxID=148309 RepID=A0AAD5QZE1_PARTN|nr:hypothetical protein KIN20_027489 [Parelaphostrongylus tenuis]
MVLFLNFSWKSLIPCYFQNTDVNRAPGLSQQESSTMSTSTFLRRKGIAWSTLAKAFGCEEVNDETVLMDELLELCNFWEESELIFKERLDDFADDKGSSDSDDGLETIRRNRAIVSARYSRIHSPLPCSSASSGVSSLCFNSTFRLKSQSRRASLKSNDVQSNLAVCSCSSTSTETCPLGKLEEKLLSEAAQLENAFLGIMGDDNAIRSNDTVASLKIKSDDFWSEVEF